MKNSSVKYLTILIIFYMLAALAWWTVLLLKFNTANLALAQTADVSSYSKEAIEDFSKNKNMIIGEGLVFAIALVTGVYLLYRSYKRELATTHKQNNFLMSVTHELKTPLSVMKLSNETMRKRTLDDQTHAKLLDIDQQEINRLEGLINNLLLSSKLDQKHIAQKADLSLLLRTRAELFNNRFANRVTHEIEHSIMHSIDKNLFATAIDNLLDNALKYSKEEVTVKLKKIENSIELQVLDKGIGIPKEERKRVFEKFYRVGDENTRSTQGTGLGLFLSKSIIETHGGTIHITGNNPKGTVFTIRLKSD